MKITDKGFSIVQLDHVTKTFRTNGHLLSAVSDVSLKAFSGELLLLLGPSGSGKTTLLTLIAGLIKPTSGTVSLFGRNVGCYSSKELQTLRAGRLGFVFQTFLLIESLTVVENVALVLRFVGKSRVEARWRALQLLEQFRIADLGTKFPPTLSQGERQRVAVARAIANSGDLILADEPTGNLESKQGFKIIQLLHQYAKEQGKCVIVASHDLRIVEFADRTSRLEDGVLNDSAEICRT